MIVFSKNGLKWSGLHCCGLWKSVARSVVCKNKRQTETHFVRQGPPDEPCGRSQGASENEIKIQSGMAFEMPMKKDIFVLQTILSKFSESGLG